jgi:hypothetical protein
MLEGLAGLIDGAKAMINWLKKLLGLHACEEFTRWTERTQMHESAVWLLSDGDLLTKVIKRRWQERACTICGKVKSLQLPWVEPLEKR